MAQGFQDDKIEFLIHKSRKRWGVLMSKPRNISLKNAYSSPSLMYKIKEWVVFITLKSLFTLLCISF